MAVYCTVDQVRGVLARDITDVDGTGATLIDPDLLEYHIASAQAEVDARLAGRYAVPFADGSVPALAVSLTVDVAAYLATLTYRQGKDVGVDDPVVRRYQRALDILKALGDGSMDLPQVPDPSSGGETPVSSGTATVRNPYAGSLFGMRDFGLDFAPSNPRSGDYRVW